MVWRYGWPSVALGLVLWAAWKAGQYIGARLLNEHNGLLTVWVAENVQTNQRLRDYMDRDEMREAERIRICADHANGARDAAQELRALKSAAREGCKLCRAWARSFPDREKELNSHIDKIEDSIREQ